MKGIRKFTWLKHYWSLAYSDAIKIVQQIVDAWYTGV